MREDEMSGEEKLAIAVIHRAVLDLLNKKAYGRTKIQRKVDYDSAKRFLGNLSKNKDTPWAALASGHLNIPKLERWAKIFP
jgi:hypothetical protein